jgi:MFS family permease
MFSRDFWLYLASRFCTATAMMMLRATIAWHVYALSHSAFHLGLIGLVQFLPVPALMLVGGALADARDRRRIMMLAQVVTLAAALSLAVATHRDAATLPLLYVTVMIVGAAWAFDAPSRAALLPTLVPREVFPRAVTIAGTNQALAFATGPALAGWTIAAGGIAASYAVQAALVAASLAMLTSLRAPHRRPAANAFDLRAVRAGLRFVVQNRVVLGCMTLDLLAVIFGGAAALLPIYARDILHVAERGYGLLASSLDIGALLMSVVLVVLPPIQRAGRALIVAVASYGIATVVFGLSRWFPLSMLAYMAVGMADQVSVVMRGTVIQLATPDAIRGRVSGVNMIFIGASNQLGAAESGFVAALTTPTFSVVSGGVASVAVVAAVAALLPELRRYRIGSEPAVDAGTIRVDDRAASS